MRKRAHGEGTIYQREDGLWVGQVTLPTGKRKTKYGKTQKQVKDWLHDQKEAIKSSMWVDQDNLTLGDFIDRYMSDVAEHTLRPRTVESYHTIVNNHIKPTLEKIKLSQLRPDHIQNLYSQKLKDGLTENTVRHIHAVLHKALKQAVKWGLAVRNVTDLVEPPVPKKQPPTILTPSQAKYFLSVVKDDRLYPLYLTEISTGMRAGEVTGLMWEDLDLNSGVIHVQRTVQQLKHQGLVLSDTKTKQSHRTIKLPEFVVEVLKTHKETSTSKFVFATKNGTPFAARNILRHFHKVLRRYDLPQIRFHDLRHTFASILLNENVHPKVVQEMLGHSTITTTLDIYSHLLPERQQEVADKLGELLQ